MRVKVVQKRDNSNKIVQLVALTATNHEEYTLLDMLHEGNKDNSWRTGEHGEPQLFIGPVETVFEEEDA